ncbi:hypothetical protein BDV96DRAFT_576726 [Lophiotrema nucula]|uniref:Hyaluronan/mRNA-binding protein domain-containing protein n=1 Tax=Lophiotrema nucula TaxID=690887 RepID=A0A6A5Z5W7_9PLEO|nr:hypothetical protein BDV96DRAFT_576726 [Lophiotrema nucula]
MSIASKNLYDLLGNDADQDPDREPEPPTKAIDKPAARTGKRNAPAEAPARTAPSTGGRQRDTNNANDNAFKDRGVGHDRNRARGTGDRGEIDGNRERGRGRDTRGRGRGRGSGGAIAGDRHSKTGIAEHDKQAAHGWGGATGNDEWTDEQAGDAIAKADEKEATKEDATTEANAEPEAEAEPEDKTKSYAAWLAEQAEKKLALGSTEVRKPNEGSSKKFPEGKAIEREEEDFFAGSTGKAKRERERKQKNIVELDDSRLHAAGRQDIRGGRGGGRGRGEGRGRGRGEGRGEGRGRGGGEGGGGGFRGRGGRGGQSGPNITDSSAFPSLGSA